MKCNHDENKCEIDNVIQSIALQETALAHILNAEGEKIQKALECEPTISELLCINQSVANTIQDISMLEMILLNKLRVSIGGSCCGSECKPPLECGCVCVKVTDCNCSLEPIECAKVSISLKSVLCNDCDKCVGEVVCSGYTDVNGCFTACELPLGEYIVNICYKNYPPIRKYVFVCTAGECSDVEACFLLCHYEEVYVEGYVYDACGVALANSKIAINEKTTYTNSKGYFCIKDIYKSTNLTIKAYYNNVVIYNESIAQPIKSYYKILIKQGVRSQSNKFCTNKCTENYYYQNTLL